MAVEEAAGVADALPLGVDSPEGACLLEVGRAGGAEVGRAEVGVEDGGVDGFALDANRGDALRFGFSGRAAAAAGDGLAVAGGRALLMAGGLATTAGGSSLAGTMCSSKGISIPKAERNNEPSALSAAPGKSAGSSVLGDLDVTLLLGSGALIFRCKTGVTAPRLEGAHCASKASLRFEGVGFLLAAAARLGEGGRRAGGIQKLRALSASEPFHSRSCSYRR